MIVPYLNAILLAYISALIMYPFYKYVYRRLPPKTKRKEAVAITITITLAIIVVLIPLILVVSVAVAQATDLANDVSNTINQSTFENAIDSINAFINNLPFKNLPMVTPETITTVVQSLSHSFISFATTSIPEWGSSAISFFTNLIIYIVMLAYITPNVKNIYNFALKVLPLDRNYSREFLDTANTITVDMLKGTFIVALVQGALVWFIFVILDTPYTMLLTLIATILAIIPYVGTSFVTVPVAIIYALSGNWVFAIILMVWQLVVVSISDNIIRSKLLANKSKISIPFALLGILGGLKMFGIVGLIYGPLIVTLLTTTIDIYTKEFLNVKFEKEDLDT